MMHLATAWEISDFWSVFRLLSSVNLQALNVNSSTKISDAFASKMGVSEPIIWRNITKVNQSASYSPSSNLNFNTGYWINKIMPHHLFLLFINKQYLKIKDKLVKNILLGKGQRQEEVYKLAIRLTSSSNFIIFFILANGNCNSWCRLASRSVFCKIFS